MGSVPAMNASVLRVGQPGVASSPVSLSISMKTMFCSGTGKGGLVFPDYSSAEVPTFTLLRQ